MKPRKMIFLLLIQLYWDNLNMNSFEFTCCEVSQVLSTIDPCFKFYKMSAYTSVIWVLLVVASHDTKCTCICSSTSTCIALSTLYRLQTLDPTGTRTKDQQGSGICILPKIFWILNHKYFWNIRESCFLIIE